MKKTIILLLTLTFTLVSYAQQVYVNQAAQGLNDGSSWTDAYTDLDYAIEQTTSGEIWVAAGVYKPTTDLSGAIPANEAFKTFRLKENIAIYGGFIGNETAISQRDWINNPTVLSGDIGVAGDLTDNVRNVVSSEYVALDENTILDGLTISDGYAYSQYNGGGIYVNQTFRGTFTIRNCIIENNYSYRGGGGLYVFNSHPIIENNIFRNNQAFQGGAIYLYYSNAIIRDNDIIDNAADNYPGSSFSGLYGGGIYVSAYSSPLISHNLIKDNYAGHEGGGMAMDGNYRTTIESNLIIENRSTRGGGLLLDGSNSYCFNNVFYKNRATEDGGAVYMDYTIGTPEFINNNFIENSANQQGGGLYLATSNAKVVNCIIYGNTPINNQIRTNNVGNNSTRIPQFKYCDIQGGQNAINVNTNNIIYENNVDIPPMFVNRSTHDFSLEVQSGLINAGTIDTAIVSSPWSGSNGEVINFPLTDIGGNVRIVDTVDIGAYEYQYTLGFSELATQIMAFYPNPSDGAFHFSPELTYDVIEVFNVQGTKLKSLEKHTRKNSFDLSMHGKGLYIVKVRYKRKEFYQKVVVK